jgi:GNAT superfamily N-acetyltransferase
MAVRIEAVAMSELSVQPVTTRRQRQQFLELPWKLYRGDPNWIPPLRSEQRDLVGYGPHPFYEKNQSQTFLAHREGEAVGRIAAILNQVHIQHHGERRGFFGFFECVDDEEAARALLDAARQWLAERDVRSMRGPMNPGINYVVGLLVEGFDRPPMFMMPYNPPCYARLIENYGFRKAQDLFAYWANIEMLPAGKAKFGTIAEQIIERYGIKLRELDKSRFQEDVEAFLSIYNRSMANHWGFVPMSDEEVQHMAKGLRRLLLPDVTAAAEIDGRLVGAAFCLPDYNPRIKAIDGRLFPFGFIRLLRNKRAIKKVRLLAANVLPEYQLMGVGLVLLRAMVPKGLEWGFEEVEYSWVAESNDLSRGALEKGGAKRIKTYRVYDFDP